MKLALSSLVLGLALTATAQADVQIFKILDGSVATCSASKETTSQRIAGSKILSISLEQDLSSADQAEPVLKLALVRCGDNGAWELDTNPSSEKYSLNGIDVEVSYSNFEMLLLDDAYNVVLQTKLDYLGQANSEVQSLKIVKSKQKTQDLQLIIRTKKTVKASNGYQFSDTVTFGGFRVRLNN